MKIVVVGGGKIGYQIAKHCLGWGCEVAMVELDANRAEKISSEMQIKVINGDGTAQEALKEAGAEEADIVVAVTGNDQDNMVICQLAERQFNAKKTVAMVNIPGNEKLFRWLGVNQVIGITSAILELLQGEVNHGVADSSVAGFMQGIKDLRMIQVILGPKAPVLGKRVKDIPIPNESILISIVRGDGAFVPRGNTMLEEGDLVFALTHPGVQNMLENVLKGEQRPDETSSSGEFSAES